eukprot:TRINITY_DN27668_c0_g1_i1.p1 TRINITY_DN27668_c0_g1~~TRINITY_DN27668_c0_g1_i1.p1  ORF type:complete len:550 (-),score=122.57 TRINITY_DN27668_c0_g1_i1:49-1671(-)
MEGSLFEWLKGTGFAEVEAQEIYLLLKAQKYLLLEDLVQYTPSEGDLLRYGILAGKDRNQILLHLNKLKQSQGILDCVLENYALKEEISRLKQELAKYHSASSSAPQRDARSAVDSFFVKPLPFSGFFEVAKVDYQRDCSPFIDPKTWIPSPPLLASARERFHAFYEALQANFVYFAPLIVVDTRVETDPSKPDITFYVNGTHNLNIVLLGNITKSLTSSLSSSEMERMIAHCKAVLESQPLRKFIIGFISDSHSIQFMVVQRELNQDYQFMASPVEVLSQWGSTYLFNLMRTPPRQLGNEVPMFGERFPIDFVSSGKTATYYKVRYANGVATGKKFWPTYINQLENELKHLEMLNQIPYIQQVVDSGLDYIVLAPVGLALRSINKTQFLQMIQILKYLSKLTIVHGDIQPTKILMNEETNNIILTDWGSAAQSGTARAYQGSLHYAAQDVLEAASISAFPYEHRHDLLSLIRTAFMLNHAHLRSELAQLSPLERHKISLFYDIHLVPAWRDLEHQALPLDFPSLSQAIKTFPDSQWNPT